MLALTRVEALRLAIHPVFLAGVALSLAWVFIPLLGADPDAPGAAYMALSGVGLLPLAAGTLAAAALGVARSTRSGTSESDLTLPLSKHARTGAHLVALWPAILAGTALVLAGLAFHGWNGVPVALQTGVRAVRPSAAALAQGPVGVALFGAVGVLAARIRPSLLSVAAAAPVVVAQWVVFVWIGAGPVWFAPFAAEIRIAGWQSVDPPGRGYFASSGFDQVVQGFGFDIGGPGYYVVRSFESSAARWHLLYVVGLAAVVCCASLLASAPTRRLVGMCAVMGGITVAAGSLQILNLTP